MPRHTFFANLILFRWSYPKKIPIACNHKSFKLEGFLQTIPRKTYDEPICELNNRHKADAKTKTTETSQVGDEVKPGHFWRSLKLKNEMWYLFSRCIFTKSSWASKENVHHSNVLFIGIVEGTSLLYLKHWRNEIYLESRPGWERPTTPSLPSTLLGT